MMGMKRIGVVRSGVYIYLIPVVTMLGAAVLVNETITLLQIGGALLVVAGLFLSRRRKNGLSRPYSISRKRRSTGDDL